MTVGRGWRPSIPVSSDAVHVPGTTSQRQVERLILAGGQPPGLVCGVHGAGEEPGGDEHEDEAGEA